MRGKSFLALAAALLLAAALPARADDRMAGTVHKNVRPEKQAPEAEAEKAAGKPAAESENIRPVSATGHPSIATSSASGAGGIKVRYAEIESYGTLGRGGAAGGIGADIWHGSARAEIAELIGTVPLSTRYNTLRDLAYRALLTAADGAQGAPEPGADLLTLRVEKLTRSGNFKQAIALYMKNPDDPYHERLARAGMTAFLLGGQPAIACLEMRALDKTTYTDAAFWNTMDKICTYLSSGKDNKVAVPEGIESRKTIITRITDGKTYRFVPRSPADLEALSDLEKALLFADRRINYDKFEPGPLKDIDPVLLGLLVSDPALPPRFVMPLMEQALKSGVRTQDDLVAFYMGEDIKKLLNDGKDTPERVGGLQEWQKPGYLYQLAKAPKDSKEAVLTLSKAASLRRAFGPELMAPFAPLIAATNPADYDSAVIRPAVALMAESGREIPLSWKKAWMESVDKNNGPRGKEEQLIALLLELQHPAPAAETGENSQHPWENSRFSKNQQEILKITYEKLDTLGKLHNDADVKAYEKDVGLTFTDDYVMPSIGLLDRIKKAREEKRPGEVVLLSAIALDNVPPSKLYPGVMNEVIDGLNAVGLTNEARKLAQETVLGLSE